MSPIQYLQKSLLLPLGLLAATGGSSLIAQEGGETAKPRDPAAAATPIEFTTTSRMIGATVFLNAGVKEVAKARAEDEAAKRPEATVSEWLVDSRSGELCNAVVSFGGFLGIGDKTVLVPAKELSWNNSMERYDLGWTVEQLKAKPEFDLAKACKDGLDAACGFHPKADGRHGKEAADASAPRKADGSREKAAADASSLAQKTIVGTDFVRPTCCLAKASTLADSPVHAGAKEWGTVSDLIVDRKQNTIVLAIVNHGSTLGVGGDNYLVPFKGLATCQKNTTDDTFILCAEQRTAADLAGCVRFEKPKDGVVDIEAAKRALGGQRADGERDRKKE